LRLIQFGLKALLFSPLWRGPKKSKNMVFGS
jgi:hypothetical protein